MARSKRIKINIPMTIAGVLLCLTLFSVHFTGNIYAKYATRAEMEDSARVAAFGSLTLIENGDFANAAKTGVITPGKDLTKNATVSFSAREVAVYVVVEAELSNKWETTDNRTFAVKNGDEVQLQWSVANDWTFIEKTGNRYAYYKALAPNTELADCGIISDNGKITVNRYIDRFEISQLTGLKINLKAYAIQAGNLSPAEAWDKVK